MAVITALAANAPKTRRGGKAGGQSGFCVRASRHKRAERDTKEKRGRLRYAFRREEFPESH